MRLGALFDIALGSTTLWLCLKYLDAQEPTDSVTLSLLGILIFASVISIGWGLYSLFEKDQP